VAGAGATDPAEAFFAGHPLGVAAYRWVWSITARLGSVSARVSRSQVAFRRRRGFAWLWRPGRWLANPDAEVVLSVALDRHDPSPRFKEVVHPAPQVWMHHLEIRSMADLDAETEAWLREAYERRG
jgi:hypothetical protein